MSSLDHLQRSVGSFRCAHSDHAGIEPWMASRSVNGFLTEAVVTYPADMAIRPGGAVS